VREVLECDEAVVDKEDARPAPALRQDVRFEKVAFSYEAAHPVLQAFELRIAAGETVCLLGPSGIGKSTFLHLLLRLYDVDGGRILIDGVDVRDCTQDSLRERFAFVPQDPWLLDATVAKNIARSTRTARWVPPRLPCSAPNSCRRSPHCTSGRPIRYAQRCPG
jgi:ATP-binding cassette subfamily B protein